MCPPSIQTPKYACPKASKHNPAIHTKGIRPTPFCASHTPNEIAKPAESNQEMKMLMRTPTPVLVQQGYLQQVLP